MKRNFALCVVFLLLTVNLSALTTIEVDMMKKGVFAQRRQVFMDKMDGGIAILKGAEHVIRNNDIEYEFRQDSNFYYLTGFEEPGAILVLIPGKKDDKTDEPGKFILFVVPNSPMREMWTGKHDGVDEAKTVYGANEAYPVTEFDTKLRTLLMFKEKIYCNFSQDELLQKITDKIKHHAGFESIPLLDPRPLLGEMRQIKSADELKLLQKAVDITSAAQQEAMKALVPGMYEYEVTAILNYVFGKNASPRSGCMFIVASGPNSAVIHYNSNNRQMQKEDLLLIDISAEYGYYAADISRTFPVSGTFSQNQKDIYNIVLKAQEKAIKNIKPGVGLREVMNYAIDELKDGLFNLGLITDKQSQWQTMVWIFSTGISHSLGIDIHDVEGSEFRSPKGRILEPGMVFTVEPGIYINVDILDKIPSLAPPSIPKEEIAAFVAKVRPIALKYKDISVRIEDDVVVTETGYNVLSASTPKTVAEIEKLMKQQSHFNK